VLLSPPVWPGPDSEGAPFPLTNPAIVPLPLGFLGCWLGTILSSERTSEADFDELAFRSRTGYGAEA